MDKVLLILSSLAKWHSLMSTNSPSLLKKSPKDQVRKVAFTLQSLYGPMFFFFWFWGHRRLWPPNQKKHGSVPIPQNMVWIVYTGKNVRSVLLFPWVRTPFSSRVNGLFVSNPFSLVSAVWTIGHDNHASDCEIPCF